MPVAPRERRIQIALPPLHAAQQSIVEQAKRFNVLNCGRRFGKDVLAIDRLVRAAVRGQIAAWYSPTYRSLTEVWRTLTDLLAEATERKSEQEHRLELLGGGVVELWSLDDPHASRGRANHLVVVNEAASVPRLQEAWEQVIRPTLTDHRGAAWFLSTPRGFNYFKALYDRRDSDWVSWTYPTAANPHIDPAEIEAARAMLPPRTFAQEYEAAFLASGGCLFDIEAVLAARAACRAPIETALNGGLRVWQRPMVGHRYVAGADVAEGKDAGNDSMDYSGVAIYDWQTCTHVADLHGQWPLDVYAAHVDEICRRYNNALLGVERNNHGHAVLLVLRQLGYPALYEHNEQNELERRQGRQRLVAGWPTTVRTKPVMEQELGAAIVAGSTLSWDQAFWDECLGYVQHGDGRTGAQDGAHDDRVVKHMIALQMRKAVPLLGARRRFAQAFVAGGR